MRLNPFPLSFQSVFLAQAQFMGGNAVSAAETMERLNPRRGLLALIFATASHAEAGSLAKARMMKERLLKAFPKFTLSTWRYPRLYRRAEDRERLITALRNAGVPEGKPKPPRLSIVVLPFANLSGDPKQDYFADGITEDLISDLSRIRGAFVIARGTSFTYKGKSVNVQEVAKNLNVRYVLEGSVRRSGDQVRVNAQLIDGRTGAHIWSERFDRTM